MAINTSTPASPMASPKTLSAALAEDRRLEARRRAIPGRGPGQGRLLLLPVCGGGGRPAQPYAQLMLKLHRWGAACLPKSTAALSGARTPTPSRTSRSSTTPTASRKSRSSRRIRSPPRCVTVTEWRPLRERDEAAVSVAEERPLREREEAAVSLASRRPLREREEAAVEQATPAESKANAVTATEVASGEQSNWSGDTASTVGRGSNIWVRVSRKTVLQDSVESPQPSVDSPSVDSPTADDIYVWAEKYRPNSLKEFICNKDVADELYSLVTAHECNHLIFEGPHAVGKRSMVMAFIRDAFNPDDVKIEEREKRIELKGEIAKHIDIRVKISSHHVEVNLADLHGYEKHVITTLLNESIAAPKSMCDHNNCKVIVVHDADRLSSDLQHYIGWFLGRYAGCNKIIFCCSDSSNLESIKHLCKIMTLQPPSFDEIIKVLEYIASKEGIDLPRGIARRITASASNNLRQAIRSFEATWKAKYPFTEERGILTGWEEEISNVAKRLIQEPSPKQLYLIRGKIRKLIEHNVSPYFIFCHLVTELKRDMDEEFQNSIDQLASELNRCKNCKFKKEQCKRCQHRETTLGMKDISIEGFSVESHDQGDSIQCFIKIEEFTVRFMSFYRSLLAKNSNRGSVP